MRTPTHLALAMLGLTIGCGSKSSGDSACLDGSCGSENIASSGVLPPETTTELAACTAELPQEDIDQTLAVVLDLQQSYHEMVACGGLTFTLIEAVFDLISKLAENPRRISSPDGFSFSDGVFVTEGNGSGNVRMELGFLYGDDYEVGEEGELVVHHLFDVDSYLVNPSLDIDYASGKLLIRYDETGPLVELLGFGADPGRPIRVSLDNLGRVGRELPKLRLQTRIEVDDPRAVATVRYTLESPPQTLSSLRSGAELELSFVAASGENARIEQELHTEDWEVDYLDDRGGLEGDIDFITSGGAFPFHGVFSYDGGGWPRSHLSCVE